jgi:3-methyl-2-oxobutanoate hydroxymethyltransferase
MSQHPQAEPGRDSRPRRNINDLAAMKTRGERITMVTVYDAPSARLADQADVDVALIGDSAAMTVLGHDSTLPVTMEEMLMLVSAARRGAERALVVADMPFGSFQASDETAVLNAVRFIKEAGADAVKLEGAGPMLRRITAVVDAGIPVFGHLGLTPQSIKALGTYKLQARTADAALKLADAARSVERAGCVGVVLEAIPAPVAAHLTRILAIPTIGIGAGPSCDGQVLVWHDLLGMTPGRVPRFVKRYEQLAERTEMALRAYVEEVRSGAFPSEAQTYTMSDEERVRFETLICESTPSGPQRS